ncbi:MAG: hypothetical protein H6Q56_986, partial [Deltaproteobacteria bacterium]|nr:hypothetical protein [Deltaproteobacteria bacterium]
MITFMGSVINEGHDLHDVWQTVVTQHGMIGFHIDDFADELGMQADLHDLEQAALQHDGEFCGVGSVN